MLEGRKLLDVKDLKEEYPVLTNWAINKAIKEYNMPVIKIGRKRYFSSESIALWLKKLEETEE